MQELARKRNGYCISDEYVNINNKLQWKCADGHVWEAVPSSIMYRGSWCPNCRYLGERKCRYVFESLFNLKFPKTRIKLDDGKVLILDGYSKALDMAFEYQGQQHYRYMPHLHKHRRNFKEACKRDSLKVEWCNISGIRLIVIPYWENNGDEELLEFVCKETGVGKSSVDWS